MSACRPMSSLWFLLCFLLIVFLSCEGRIVGRCFQNVEGTRCHESKKDWQHDGVCVKNNEEDQGRCHVPDSGEFKLAVVAQWRKLRRLVDAKTVTTLWIRGSGPGLSWEKPIELQRTATNVDTWRVDLTYSAGSDSQPCFSSTHCSMNQGFLEFRLYRDELATEGMLGPNFLVPLPISHSLTGAVDFLTPSVTVRPWFDGDQVVITSYVHQNADLAKEGIQVSLLHPPSFEYNVRKNYPLVVLFGKREPQWIAPLLERLFVHEASVDEVSVVVIEYLDEAPFCQLNPYSPGGLNYVCKSGDTCHECQSCWDSRRVDTCDKDEFIYKTKRCLKAIECAGKGGEMLDVIEQEILPEVQERTQNRLLIDFPKNRLSIIGMDGAGLLACYAALTRPVVYANAGCLSAPFYWPLRTVEGDPRSLGMDALFGRIKQSIQELPGYQIQYLTQKYYIDNGAYDNFYFPSFEPHLFSEQFVSHLQELGLKLHENIVYANIPGQGNSYYHQKYHSTRVLNSIQYPLTVFYRSKGGPSEKLPKTLKISEELFAERAKVLEGLHVPGIVHVDKGGQEESVQMTSGEVTSWGSNRSFCSPDGKLQTEGVPVPVFLTFTGLSVLISVAVTVMIMCLRDSNRRATEEAEKEEAELMDGELGSSDGEDF